MSRIAAVCRVCLAFDAKMHHIKNTPVQEVFEKLTSKKLTENGRPETVCYLCYSYLLKSSRILNLIEKTENVFAQFHSNGIEINDNIIEFLKKSNIVYIVDLSMTPVAHLELDCNDMDTFKSLQEATIKEEWSEAEVKEELVDNDFVEFEGALYDDNCIQSEDINEVNEDPLSFAFEVVKETQCLKSSEEAQVKSKEENNLLVELSTSSVLSFFSIKKQQKAQRNKTNAQVKIKEDKDKQSNKQKNTKSQVNSKMKYTCKTCKKTFKTQHYFVKHNNTHHSKKLYTCDKCKESFLCKSNYTRHFMIKMYPCNKCHKIFSRCDFSKSHVCKFLKGLTEYSPKKKSCNKNYD